MLRGETLHSRLVGALRLLLPLMALALLSTLFLLPREIDPSRALPYATVDAEALARDPRITEPRFSGMTDDGTAVTMTARSVRIAAGPDETIRAEGAEAIFAAADGSLRTFTARDAELDRAGGWLELRGDVRMTDSRGYSVESGHIRTSLDRDVAESPGPVVAVGPQGRIEAGAMRLTAGDAGRMQFTGGVRLLHPPPEEGG